MYLKDKDFRISVRLTQSQYNFIKAHADLVGVSPSQFLRMVVNANMAVETDVFNADGHIKPGTDADQEAVNNDEKNRLWRVKDSYDEQDLQALKQSAQVKKGRPGNENQ